MNTKRMVDKVSAAMKKNSAVKLPDRAITNINETAKYFGVDSGTAMRIIVHVKFMLMGLSSSKSEYERGIRAIEKDVGKKLLDKFPPFVKGGDPEEIAAFEAWAGNNRTEGEKSTLAALKDALRDSQR